MALICTMLGVAMPTLTMAGGGTATTEAVVVKDLLESMEMPICIPVGKMVGSCEG